MMYYVQKTGVHFASVFWIGTDLDEGKLQADIGANSDDDDYHAWVVREYHAPNGSTDYEGGSKHKVVYTAKRLE